MLWECAGGSIVFGTGLAVRALGAVLVVSWLVGVAHAQLSLEELEREAALVPNDPVLVYRLGQARAGSGDLEGALRAFEHVDGIVAPERRRLAIFAIAQTLMLMGRTDEALAVLDRPELDPGEAAEFRVVLLAGDGQLDAARAALDVMVETDPDRTPRREIYAELLDLAETDPERLAGIDFQIEERPLAEWQALAALSFGYNSNVVGLGDGQALPTDISSEASPVSRVLLDLFWRTRLDGDAVLAIGAQAGFDRYRNVHSLDSDRGMIWTEYARKLGEEMLLSARLLGDVYLQDDEYVRGRGATRLAGTWRWHEQYWTELALDYAYADFDDVSFPTFDRDGSLYSLSLNQSVALPSWGTILTLGAAHDIQDTDGSDYDYTGNRLTFAAHTELTDGLVLGLGAGIGWLNFENPNSLTGFTQARDDRITWLQGRLGWTMRENLELFASYSLTDNHSNIAFYRYDRHETMAGVALRF